MHARAREAATRTHPRGHQATPAWAGYQAKRTCRPPAPATPVAHAPSHCGSTRAHLRSKLL